MNSAGEASVLQQEDSSLLLKGAIEEVSSSYLHRGFFSQYFLVLKKDGVFRPILDLRRLNYSLYRGKFKMLTLKSILSQVQEGDWFITVDLKDAYFHIQVVQRHRKFLRFAFGGKAYQYKVLPFGLALAPRTYIKCIDAALAPLRLQGIRILNYLDDWLILASSREQVIRHRDSLLLHIHMLSLRLNGQKSVLTPAQQTIFLGGLSGLNLDAGPSSGRGHSVVLGLLQARSARVSGPVSQTPRPHGGSFPSSSLGAAPYETIPLVDEIPGYSPLLAIPSPTKSVRRLFSDSFSVAGSQFSPEWSSYGGSLPLPNDKDRHFPLRVGSGFRGTTGS